MMVNGGDFTMAMGNIKNGKLLYHLTELANLDSIIEHGLLARKDMIEKQLIFEDIADQEIISKRTELGLDDYIPFHFHPYSSFDAAVKNTNPDTEFIYLCFKREDARDSNFKIITTHPLSLTKCELLDYDDGFSKIDWETMQSYGTEDDYKKHVKMAECLTNEYIIQIDNFHSIGVRNADIQKIVEDKLKANGITNPPYVDVRNWF